jgi:hypothetical protein
MKRIVPFFLMAAAGSAAQSSETPRELTSPAAASIGGPCVDRECLAQNRLASLDQLPSGWGLLNPSQPQSPKSSFLSIE